MFVFYFLFDLPIIIFSPSKLSYERLYRVNGSSNLNLIWINIFIDVSIKNQSNYAPKYQITLDRVIESQHIKLVRIRLGTHLKYAEDAMHILNVNQCLINLFQILFSLTTTLEMLKYLCYLRLALAF